MYTIKDCGCYIDGSLGPEHSLWRLGQLVGEFDPYFQTEIEALEYTVNEEERAEAENELFMEGVTILQNNTEETCFWHMDAGDLLLLSVEQLN